MLMVGVGDAEGVGVGELVGVEVGVGVGWTGVGFGAATFTPLFHTSFLPLLMQVYFFPPDVAVNPTFLQLSPAFTAAIAFNGAIRMEVAITIKSIFFMVL